MTLTELQDDAWTAAPGWTTSVPWESGPGPLHDTTLRFREVVLPALAALGPPEDVRVLLWFDSGTARRGQGLTAPPRPPGRT